MLSSCFYQICCTRATNFCRNLGTKSEESLKTVLTYVRAPCTTALNQGTRALPHRWSIDFDLQYRSVGWYTSLTHAPTTKKEQKIQHFFTSDKKVLPCQFLNHHTRLKSICTICNYVAVIRRFQTSVGTIY